MSQIKFGPVLFFAMIYSFGAFAALQTDETGSAAGASSITGRVPTTITPTNPPAAAPPQQTGDTNANNGGMCGKAADEAEKKCKTQISEKKTEGKIKLVGSTANAWEEQKRIYKDMLDSAQKILDECQNAAHK